MKELKVLNHEGTLVVDSRDVANMIGKQHAHLMRDIQGYIQILESNAETLAAQQNPNLDSANFFLESTYVGPKGETRPCYLLTKQCA